MVLRTEKMKDAEPLDDINLRMVTVAATISETPSCWSAPTSQRRRRRSGGGQPALPCVPGAAKPAHRQGRDASIRANGTRLTRKKSLI